MKNNHLEMSDGSHICLYFNVRNSCALQPSSHHGSHSCSLWRLSPQGECFLKKLTFIVPCIYTPLRITLSHGTPLWLLLIYYHISLIWCTTLPMAPQSVTHPPFPKSFFQKTSLPPIFIPC